MAAIAELKSKIEFWFDRLEVRVKPILFFNGYYFKALRTFVLTNLDSVKAQIEDFFNRGDYAGLVEFLRVWANGNLPVSWIMRPFAKMFLNALADWAIQNQNQLRDAIGMNR